MSSRRIATLVATAALGLTLAACGSSTSHSTMPGMNHSGGAATTVTGARTVDVTMADIRFEPPTVDVKVGETVRFVFHNQGKLAHEAVIGDTAAQDAHEMDMAASGGTGMHDASGAVSVAPGQSGELTHTFSAAGPLVIGCHQPGHYAAGMKLAVNVM